MWFDGEHDSGMINAKVASTCLLVRNIFQQMNVKPEELFVEPFLIWFQIIKMKSIFEDI